MEVDSSRAIANLKELAGYGRCGTGVDRRSGTLADLESRRWLREEMRGAGLNARIDPIGTVVGRTSHARRLLIGSHTDTVRKGGWLDGSLGVIAGLEIARAVQKCAPDFALGVEVVSFADEEGQFLPLLGSKVFCGDVTSEEAGRLRNSEGQMLEDVIRSAGLATHPIARLAPDEHVGYLELHIEQGPVLESSGTALGVVTGIVGMRQDEIEFVGTANHAGTTPMRMRHDAAAALFQFAATWQQECTRLATDTTVWNIGHVLIEPGAHNVVADRAVATCQYRGLEDHQLDALEAAQHRCATKAAEEHRVHLRAKAVLRVPPTPMDRRMIDVMSEAAKSRGHSVRLMPSGAGHDAMTVGRHMPAGMLFVPSVGGVSHSVEENTTEESLACGIETLAAGFTRLAEICGEPS